MHRKKRQLPYHQNRQVVIISILGFILASFVFMQLKGGPTGFMVYEPNKIEVGEIMRGKATLTLVPIDRGNLPLGSLEISGKVVGEGGVRVFLKNNEEWLLVYSNRDDFIRPGLLIEGKIMREKIIKAEFSYGERLLRVMVRGEERPEFIAEEDFWEVPSTCWETCMINGLDINEYKLYFDIEDGTAFYLDKISVS